MNIFDPVSIILAFNNSEMSGEGLTDDTHKHNERDNTLNSAKGMPEGLSRRSFAHAMKFSMLTTSQGLRRVEMLQIASRDCSKGNSPLVIGSFA
jgi:hypothetical protein